MNFDARERQRLAAIADQLIPRGEGSLSASEAGVAHEGLDLVLAVRPELGPGLKNILEMGTDKTAAELTAQLRRDDPGAFALLADWVPAAYFLNKTVREKIGYQGQGGRPIDPSPDYLADGLLESVQRRGPIYRPV